MSSILFHTFYLIKVCLLFVPSCCELGDLAPPAGELILILPMHSILHVLKWGLEILLKTPSHQQQWDSGAVVRTIASDQWRSGSKPAAWLESFLVEFISLSVCLQWILLGSSGFLPQFKTCMLGLSGGSQYEHGWLSLCVTLWVYCLLPEISWDRSPGTLNWISS